MLISSEAKIYRPELISFGDHCRVDDFVTLTPGPAGAIEVGSYVHISAYSMIDAPETVTIGDFSGFAARVTIYGCTDNYFGECLTGPCVPEKYRRVRSSPIVIGNYVIVGASSVILPGAYIAEGCAIGAMALVRARLEPWGVYSGIPVRRVLERSRKLVDLAAEVRASMGAEQGATVA